MLSNSSNKIHQTWGQPLAEPCKCDTDKGVNKYTTAADVICEWSLSVMAKESQMAKEWGPISEQSEAARLRTSVA